MRGYQKRISAKLINETSIKIIINEFIIILIDPLYTKFWGKKIISDDAEMLTSEVHDPYARTTGAWK